MTKKAHETPLLDELKSGPWPSFVEGLERLATDEEKPGADMMKDLLGQLVAKNPGPLLAPPVGVGAIQKAAGQDQRANVFQQVISTEIPLQMVFQKACLREHAPQHSGSQHCRGGVSKPEIDPGRQPP